MYPFFEILGYPIYIFGITIVICFFLFLWMLKKLSIRFGFEYNFFVNNILWYFLSVFIFSRLFYVVSLWNDMKFIKDPFEFFIMSDYKFSLFGALFGFFIILYLNTRIFKQRIHKYIDGVMLSFLFVSIVGFIGAFLGGQVYGKLTSFGFEILYNNDRSFVPLTGHLFPLPIVYSIVFFLLFSSLYILSMYLKTRGFIGYIGLGLFSAITLGLEFFSGKPDIFKDKYDINLAQICSIILIAIAFYGLYKVVKSSNSSEKTVLHKTE